MDGEDLEGFRGQGRLLQLLEDDPQANTMTPTTPFRTIIISRHRLGQLA
jgi:hypothetical protein